jgi:TorA maturation chaperone TorD
LVATGPNFWVAEERIADLSRSNSERAAERPAPDDDGALGDGAVLRPGVEQVDTVDEVDAARAKEYALLSVLLTRAPNAEMLNQLATLRGDSSPLGMAHAALGEAAAEADIERVEREYFDTFIGVGRGELVPYGSYYLTGFLNERPLARLRDDLARLGIERVDGAVEPEDHAAVLCEIMAGLVSGQFAAGVGSDRELFEKHLSPWIGRFFADLEDAKVGDFYRRIGMVGRVFIEIESEAFSLATLTRETV